MTDRENTGHDPGDATAATAATVDAAGERAESPLKYLALWGSQR